MIVICYATFFFSLRWCFNCSKFFMFLFLPSAVREWKNFPPTSKVRKWTGFFNYLFFKRLRCLQARKFPKSSAEFWWLFADEFKKFSSPVELCQPQSASFDPLKKDFCRTERKWKKQLWYASLETWNSRCNRCGLWGWEEVDKSELLIESSFSNHFEWFGGFCCYRELWFSILSSTNFLFLKIVIISNV